MFSNNSHGKLANPPEVINRIGQQDDKESSGTSGCIHDVLHAGTGLLVQ
jgi:hypothetical protein